MSHIHVSQIYHALAFIAAMGYAGFCAEELVMGITRAAGFFLGNTDTLTYGRLVVSGYCGLMAVLTVVLSNYERVFGAEIFTQYPPLELFCIVMIFYLPFGLGFVLYLAEQRGVFVVRGLTHHHA